MSLLLLLCALLSAQVGLTAVMRLNELCPAGSQSLPWKTGFGQQCPVMTQKGKVWGLGIRDADLMGMGVRKGLTVSAWNLS